jgi:hypothetical protein
MKRKAMNRHILRAAAAALVLSTASVVAFTDVASPAYAAQRGRAAEAPAVKLPPLRASVGKPLNEAVKFTNMKDWDGTMHEALEADKIEMKTPYEEYKVAQLLGFISINKQPQDLKAATAAYNRMVASSGQRLLSDQRFRQCRGDRQGLAHGGLCGG